MFVKQSLFFPGSDIHQFCIYLYNVFIISLFFGVQKGVVLPCTKLHKLTLLPLYPCKELPHSVQNSTLYSAVHRTVQYIVQCNTVYSIVHCTVQYSIVYTKVFHTVQSTTHYSVQNIMAYNTDKWKVQ